MADMVKDAAFLQQMQTNLLSDVLMGRDDVAALLSGSSDHWLNKFDDGISRMKASLADASKAATAAHAAFEAQCARDAEILRFHRLDCMSTTSQGQAFAQSAAHANVHTPSAPSMPVAPGAPTSYMPVAATAFAETQPYAREGIPGAGMPPRLVNPQHPEPNATGIQVPAAVQPAPSLLPATVLKSAKDSKAIEVVQIIDPETRIASTAYKVVCDTEMYDADRKKLTCCISGNKVFQEKAAAKRFLTQHKSDIRNRLTVVPETKVLSDMRSHKLEGGEPTNSKQSHDDIHHHDDVHHPWRWKQVSASWWTDPTRWRTASHVSRRRLLRRTAA